MFTPFSFDDYRAILMALVGSNYKVSSFERFDETPPKTVILRHDVDYTLDGVAELARIESELGCTSSFLFRVHSDAYNIAAPRTVILLRDLRSMGHEIGLHFDAMSISRLTATPPADCLLREKAILETLLGHQVATCTEHRDFSQVVHRTPLFSELASPVDLGFRFHCMDSRWSQTMKYLSDTNANWREGDPRQHLHQDRMQVLVHPDWWFAGDLLLKGAYIHSQRVAQ